MDTKEVKPNPVGTETDPSDASIAVASVNDGDWTVEEEAAVRRKFDFTIVPLVTLLYMLCAIDRYCSYSCKK
jgi:hypothetical protein